MTYDILRSTYSLSRPFIGIGLWIGSGLAITGCSQADVATGPPDDSAAQMSETSEAAPPAKEKTSYTEEANIEASTSLSSQTRSADSHVHGGARLSIAAEGSSIVMELETPLYNLLGFEYAPQTEAEKTKVKDIETRLGQPQSLMRFNEEAQCLFAEINQHIHLFEENAHEHSHGEKTQAHSHSEADEEHSHKDHTGHKDVILTYSLNCEDVSQLKTLDVAFFKDFPNFTKLDLVYLGPSQQMSTELSPSKSKADLTR
jgi:hypothetical protein